MAKSILLRAANSFCYSIGITTVIYFIMLLVFGYVPMFPDYVLKFNDSTTALIVQLVLVGAMSASLGAGTVIMEIERLSLVVQSIIFFIFSSAVWVSVAVFCWGFGTYAPATISVSVSFVLSYVITWVIQYRICRKNVEQINEKLMSLGQSD